MCAVGGARKNFPQVGIEEDVAEVMAAFLGQYYISSPAACRANDR